MGSSGHRRVTVSLPPAALEQLDFVANRLGCSRSAFLSEMLLQSLPSIVEAVEYLPPGLQDATTDDIRRMRGASARLIGRQVERLILGAQDDLFRK